MEEILDLCFEGLSVQPITQELIEDLLVGTPVAPQVAVEFGVDTLAHYKALQAMVENAFACWREIEDEEGCWYALRGTQSFILDLDRARNNSDKLNKLIYMYAPRYVNQVRFHTTWDLLMEQRAKAEAGEIH